MVFVNIAIPLDKNTQEIVIDSKSFIEKPKDPQKETAKIIKKLKENGWEEEPKKNGNLDFTKNNINREEAIKELYSYGINSAMLAIVETKYNEP